MQARPDDCANINQYVTEAKQKRYVVRLTLEERDQLEGRVNRGREAA